MDGEGTLPSNNSRAWAWITRLGLGAISLIAANSILLFVYFAFDISLFQLVLVYWCECAWIGLAGAVKLTVASIVGNPYENRWAEVSRGSSLMFSLFVIFFSGMAFFTFIGVLLMLILFANDVLALSSTKDEMINHIGLVLGTSLLLMSGHAVSLISNYFVLGEYKTARVWPLVVLPFKRCAALLMAMALSIGAVALVPGFANTGSFAAIVIVLKVLWDIDLHKRERRAMA